MLICNWGREKFGLVVSEFASNLSEMLKITLMGPALDMPS